MFSPIQFACFYKLIVKWVDQVIDIVWLKTSPHALPNAADFIFAPPTPTFRVGAPLPPTLNLWRATADQMMPTQGSKCSAVFFLCALLISRWLTWTDSSLSSFPLIPILCSSFEACVSFLSYQSRQHSNTFLPLVGFPCILPSMTLCNKFPLLKTCPTHAFCLSLTLAKDFFLLLPAVALPGILSIHLMFSMFLHNHLSSASSL